LLPLSVFPVHRFLGIGQLDLQSFVRFALGTGGDEANYLRLCDVKTRLSKVEGTEALIEGFGASSGRPGKTI